MKFCKVLVNINSNTEYIYSIPENLSKKITNGSIVIISFRGRKRYGIVLSLTDSTIIKNIKPITDVHFNKPVNSAYIDLIKWISEYYFSSRGNVLRNLLPSLKKNIKRYTLTNKNDLTDKTGKYLDGLYTKKQLMKTTGINESDFDKLFEEETIIEELQSIIEPGSDTVVLNSEQMKAYNILEESISENKYSAFLLHGPPASGKSEVYMKAIDHVIKNTDRNIVLLLPEIGLAQYMYQKIINRFGSKLAGLYNSELSDGERYFYINAFIEGRKRILVGTRSATFVPIKNIGLIIVDEEQDMSFKQTDSAPYYNARDIAVYSAYKNNATVMLASATPSLETYNNVLIGKYKKLLLEKTFMNTPIPEIRITGNSGIRRILPVYIMDAISNNIRNKKQTMIFINRRGYLNLYKCKQCGTYFSCDNCSVSYSYHKSSNEFLCHYCGSKKPYNSKCPKCNGKLVSSGVWGTEKIEDIINKMYPDASIKRMDIDSSSNKGVRKQIIDSMINGETDILIGTQMISKGYDIPNVNTVIILNADNALHLPDFRTEERFLQLLVQTAGRAGRRNEKGNIIIEGNFDDVNVSDFIKKLDYNSFVDIEMKRREELDFPPFSRVMRIIVKGKDKNKTIKNINEIFSMIDKYSKKNKNIRVFPPMPQIVEQVAGVYRYNIYIFYKEFKVIYNIINKLRSIRNDFSIDNDTY